MLRQPYCWKRYFEMKYAFEQTKGEARHWLKMHFGKTLLDNKLLAIESGAIVTTNLAWYSQDKELLEGLTAPETEKAQ